MKQPLAVLCSAAITLAGCATPSQDIATAYVAPLQYQSYDCAQLAAEAERIQLRVVQLGSRLDQAVAKSAAAPSAAQGIAGLRFMIRDSDAITRLITGESLVTIDAVSARGAVLNGGATMLDANGKVVSGSLMLPHLEGLGGGRLRPGFSTSAIFIANGAAPTPLRVTVMRMEALQLADREISVARCQVSGQAARGGPMVIAPPSRSWDGAPISGDITVEPQTGLTLAAALKSANPYYSFNRTVAPGGTR